MVAAPNPILEAVRFRREVPEARHLEECLADAIRTPEEAGRVASRADLDMARIEVAGPPHTLWANILDGASQQGRLAQLLDTLDAENLHPRIADATRAVREASRSGSLQPQRLLLQGNRPFLGRSNLRGLLPELQDWNSSAAVLVVRGVPASGRTATQDLLADLKDEHERSVLLHEDLSLQSSMHRIWREVGGTGKVPLPGAESTTTDSAVLIDFWTEVLALLKDTGRRLWVLVDDLDKGPGRLAVRALAEVLAVQLRDIAFQRRIRLVLLAYPDPEVPQKVRAALVRNDETEIFDATHVEAFLDYCLTAAGKNFDRAALPALARDLCAQACSHVAAASKEGRELSFHAALHDVLRAWHRTVLQ